MFRKIVDTKKEVAVLDIGTSAICATIAKLEKKDMADYSFGFGNEIRVLGVGSQLAKGIKNNAITNLEEFEESVIGAISSAEKEAQKSIKSVFVAIPSWAITSHAVEASMDIGQLPVDDIHLCSLMNFGSSKCLDKTQEVIHVFPVSYSIDEIYGIKDPVGMVGNKLSATFHVMTAKSSFVKNVKNCLNRNGIDVIGFISSTYASILSVASDDELSSGVTLIDIGGVESSIACVHDGTLLYLSSVPLGGQNITNDIAMVLRTTKSNAERLKILYGISSSNVVEEESILVSRIDEYGEEHIQNVSKGMLNSIISARLEEILELIQTQLYESGADKLLYQRIVVTGGGSMLSGLNEFIKSKRYFQDSSVRLGKPIGTIGSHDFVKTPSFSAAAGSVIYCLCELYDKRLQNNGKSIWQRIITWIRRGV